MTNNQLIVEIEKARNKMCNLADEHPLQSPEVIQISSYLDNLLTLFQKQQSSFHFKKI